MRIFKEEQHFTQTWLIILLIISMLTPLAIMINEYAKDKSTMSLNELLISTFIMFAFTTPIFFFKLKTRIDEKGIHYQFIPFQIKSRIIEWSELKSAYTRKYDAISEFGGWGLKGGFIWKKSKGVAYNVSGDLGIQLEFKTGKKILIGTNKINEVNAVLKNYEEKILTNG